MKRTNEPQTAKKGIPKTGGYVPVPPPAKDPVKSPATKPAPAEDPVESPANKPDSDK
jgi:hypothetical protein